MTLEQLRIFVAVAERQHVTRAAEVLHLTQSAVSAAVSGLEERHAAKLFHRVGRRIELSEAGRLFLTEARGVLQRVAAAELLLADLSGLKRGTLSVQASQTVASYWLPGHLARYHGAYPDIEIALKVGNTAAVAAAVLSGAAELGFVEGAVDEPALSNEIVAHDDMALVVGAAHQWRKLKEPVDLRTTAWVLREAGSGTRSTFEALLARRRMSLDDLAVAMVLPTNEAVRSAVEAGAGATVMSALVVEASLRAKRLIRIPLDIPPRTFAVLRSKERYRSRAAGALLDSIAAAGSAR